MTNVEIKRVSGMDFFTIASRIGTYAFRPTPTPPETAGQAEALPYLDQVRAYGVFADGEPQATATLFPMHQNVRGKVLPMSGVGGVATMPAARRQGHVRRLFTELFASMRDNGEAVSTLYPFRESFYERLGYAAMPQAKYARFSPATLTPLSRLEKHGRIEQTMIADGFDDWRAYLTRYQRQRHGFTLNDLPNALRVKHNNRRWLALARDEAGQIVGGMTYRITDDTMTRMDVPTFLYDSPSARLLLLDWFARHVDQVDEVKVRVGPAEMPDLWFPDLYARLSNHERYFTPPMGRVMDVLALTGMNVGPGSITVEITDTQCPWVGGVYSLSSTGDGTLAIEPGGEPTAMVTIQGLSALVYAGQDPAEFPLHGWGNPDPAAQATLRTMFPPAYPLLHEDF